MLYFRRSRFIRFVILPLTLVALLPACQGWVGVNTAVESPTAISGSIRVTLNDGEEIKLEDATVTIDSVFGWREGAWRAAPGETQPVRIALDDVAKIDEQRTKTLATVGVVWLAVLVVAGIVLAFSDEPCFDAGFGGCPR